MSIANELEKARQAEQVKLWDAGEAELRKGFPARSLSVPVDIRDRFGLFEKFCSERSCRRLPAKPWVVASFVLHEAAAGRDAQGCIALLAAIAEIHDVHSLSNPTATGVVRTALELIIKTEPPRSWPKEDRASWATLPPEIREAIARREDNRDRALKTKFQELADLRKRLTSGADKPVQTNEGLSYDEATQRL